MVKGHPNFDKIVIDGKNKKQRYEKKDVPKASCHHSQNEFII